jgi:hypothetical protein
VRPEVDHQRRGVLRLHRYRDDIRLGDGLNIVQHSDSIALPQFLGPLRAPRSGDQPPDRPACLHQPRKQNLTNLPRPDNSNRPHVDSPHFATTEAFGAE